MTVETVPARSGIGLQLARGQILRVIDPLGGHSGDLVAFESGDRSEWLSNGRSAVQRWSRTAARLRDPRGLMVHSASRAVRRATFAVP